MTKPTQIRQPPPPPGNFKLHCKRHYTCENHTNVIYLVRCRLCNVNYVGQTTRTMRQRHLGHRAEIRAGADGLGRHFLEHGNGLDLKKEEIFENNVMKYFELSIIGSVEPNKNYSQQNLDRLEGNLQKKLMTMEYHGGINLRDETRRRHGV